MRYALAIIVFALPMFGQTTETFVFDCNMPCSLSSSEPTTPWQRPSCRDYWLDDALIESMNHNDRSAVELLQKRHAITLTYSERHRIAAALLHHVPDDSAYWNEIFEHAENAVRFAPDGDAPNPRFEKWCADHGFDRLAYEPMSYDALRTAGNDPRSHALLIRALDSPDFYIVGGDSRPRRAA